MSARKHARELDGRAITVLSACLVLLPLQMLQAFEDVPLSKTHRTVHRRFAETAPGETVRLWVLFDPLNKGFEGGAAVTEAIESLAQGYNARAKARRALRRTRPGLFDITDLPVPPAWVAQVRATGVRVHVVSRWLNGVSVDARRDQLPLLEGLPFVRKIQPVRRAKRIEVSTQPGAGAGAAVAGGVLYGESEAQLAQINLTALHDLGYTGDGVVVGVLDTGFNRTHAAFNEPGHPVDVVAEYDFVNDDPDTAFEEGDPSTQHSHGTYILGVLGAYKPGELVGGAFDASFILCKTEDTTDEYPAEEDNYVAGLEFIESNGGDMATASLGYIDWYTQEDLDGLTAVTTIAVNIATGNGVHCCNAAGNGGHDSDPATSALIAPSDALGVITCGAVNEFGEIAGFSSDGPTADGRVKPEVLARGVNTRTVASLDDLIYTGVNGTSLSTPVVAAAVACLVQAHPDWTTDRMRAHLVSTASRYVAEGSPDPMYVEGFGILDVLAAHAGDCDGNLVADETDIAEGTYADCNGNAVPDVCDIGLGFAADDNLDGVPDVCGVQIPAVSSWGVIVLALAALAAGSILFRRGASATV